MTLTKTFQEPANGQDQLGVYWYDTQIGILTKDGKDTTWISSSPQYFRIFDVQDASQEPAVIKNLQPEGWLFDVLNFRDQWTYLKEGLCFLSNLRIVDPQHEKIFLESAPKDVLEGRLSSFSREDAIFSGNYQGPSRRKLEVEVESKPLATLWNDRAMPRLSGAQMKLPMCLHKDGSLLPALGAEHSFTHLLKLPREGVLQSLGAVEWLCLEISERVGIKTAAHALIPLPDGLPPALLVERFDIPSSEEDTQKILMQDFCSLAHISPHEKDSGSIEQCAKLLRNSSTDWEKDREAFFDRVVLSYAVGDGDMHRKNLSVLKKMENGNPEELTIEFSPVYDVVSTVVYKNGDQMALPLNGKRHNIDHKTWAYFGKNLGMNPQEASVRALTLIANIANEAVNICNNLPPEILAHPACVHDLQRATTEMVDLAKRNGQAVPEWNSVYEPKKEKLDLDEARATQRKKARTGLGIGELPERSFDAPYLSLY